MQFRTRAVAVGPREIRRAPLLALLALTTACGTARPEADAPPPVTPPSATAPATLPPPDWSALPPVGPAPRYTPPTVETWTLSNGVSVWFVPQNQVPLASVNLVIPRGSATDPPGKAGTTALMADLLDEGAAGRTALALGDAFQRLGTDYEANVGTDAVTLGVHLLADQLGPTLDLLAMVAFRPDFPPAELERRKQQRVASLLAAEADPSNSRSVVLRRVLFGEGYGGLPADGVRGTVGRITLADVKAQYESVFRPGGAAIVVVGALERAEVASELERAFGGWKAGPMVAPAALAPAAAPAGVYLVDHPGATQSAIVVARRAPGADAPDFFEAMIYNWAVGGAFMSRVNLNLREEKGYTYGARSGYTRWKTAGFFSVGALVKAQHTTDSIREIFRELAAAGSDRPITPDEIREARGGMLLSFPARFENMGAVAGQVAELPLYGRPADWWARWPSSVEGVSPEAVLALGRTQADPGAYVVVVAGDRATIEPGLAALNLPVQVRDAQGNPLSP
jgi:zinc protease